MSRLSKLADFLIGRSPTARALQEDVAEPGKLTDAQITRIMETVKPLTMVVESGVRFACEQTVEVIGRGIAGAIVECGVWRGGCSIAMLLAQREAFGRVERPVHMLDSFEGLPPVMPRDGPLAQRWKEGAAPERYHDNCKASLDELKTTLGAMSFRSGEYEIWPGWFNSTLPGLVETIKEQGIALLRLDGDWYDSTFVCLEQLMPLVSEDGVVIIDDYYAWDGCARAVHDYLSRHDLPYRIRSLFNCYAVYFVKKPFRDRFDIL
jgi:hypothetical protein